MPGAACRVQGTGCRVWGAAWAVLCDVGALLHGAGCAWCKVPALSAHGPGLLCWGQVWGPWGRVMGGSSRGSCSVPPSGNPWRGMPWLGHGCVLLPLFCCRGDEAVFLSQGWRWVMGGVSQYVTRPLPAPKSHPSIQRSCWGWALCSPPRAPALPPPVPSGGAMARGWGGIQAPPEPHEGCAPQDVPLGPTRCLHPAAGGAEGVKGAAGHELPGRTELALCRVLAAHKDGLCSPSAHSAPRAAPPIRCPWAAAPSGAPVLGCGDHG